METPVLFLDGQLRNTIVFGIRAGRNYKYPIPPYDIEVGMRDCGCCPETETIYDAVEDYTLVELAPTIRIGSLDASILGDKPRLLFRLCEEISKLEDMMPRSMFNGRHRPTAQPGADKAHNVNNEKSKM